MKETKEIDENKIIERWDAWCFLEDVINRRNIALAYEFTSAYLIDVLENKFYGDLSTISFPVIYRIFKTSTDDLPIDVISKNVIEIINTLNAKLQEIDATDEWINRGDNSEEDVELELVKKFCDDYILAL